MFKFIENWNSFYLVFFGSITGAFFRIKIIEYSFLISKKKKLGLLIVNFLATFVFGYNFSFFIHNILNDDNNSLQLFFVIGFLGSFSSFSSFILELLPIALKEKWREFFGLIFINLFGGLLLAYLGFKISEI
tara:strand:- start:490 stop:885 length:396 start_codon:yes stop_codon:yes gene_type:complete